MSSPRPLIWRGIVLMAGSSLLFALMSTLLRLASGIDPFKKSLFRFVVGLGILGVAALSGRIKLQFHNGPLLFARGLLGGLGVFFFFLAIDQLGIGRGTLISYTYPIFATVSSAILLREKVNLRCGLAIAASLLGIYLLCQNGEGIAAGGMLGVGWFELLAILGSVAAGLACTVIRKLHATDNSYAIFFSQCTVGMWIMIIPANLTPAEIGYTGGAMLLAIGLTAALGQLMMTQAFKTVPVALGSLLSMLVPVFNLLIGLLFFHERFPLPAAIGAAIVLVCCLIVVLDQLSKSEAPAAAPAEVDVTAAGR